MKKLLSIFATAFLLLTPKTFAAPITLNVNDADLRTTIMMVARAGKLNVSVDKSVDSKISLSLYNVDPEDALEIIAKTSNLNLVYDGSDTYIITAKNYHSIMNTYVLPIKYGNAELLKQAVKFSLDKEKDNLKLKSVTTSEDKNSKTETFEDEDRITINSNANAGNAGTFAAEDGG